jgi:hypothetical protein
MELGIGLPTMGGNASPEHGRVAESAERIGLGAVHSE